MGWIKHEKEYNIEDVFDIIDVNGNWNEKPIRVEFDGDFVKVNSLRLQTFKLKGVTCVECGIKGAYFRKIKLPSHRFYHLNLYAIDQYGDEISITKDHIYPKSKGGADHYDNLQIMCERCNRRKADKVIGNGI